MNLKVPLCGFHSFENGKDLDFQLNTLRLRIFRNGNDLLVMDQRPIKNGVGSAVWKDDGIDFEKYRRYAFEKAVDAVEIQPMNPERPLLVRPRQPLMLVPQSRVNFYVRFPLDLNLVARVGDMEQPLERVRVEVLSDTWFGDPVSGVLCFALKSRARRVLPEDENWEEGLGLCQLSIINESKDSLKCEKFCLHLKHCRLWLSGGHIWTSAVNICHQRMEASSVIHYGNEPPEGAVGAELVSEAVEVPTRGFVGRTFAFTGLAGGS